MKEKGKTCTCMLCAGDGDGAFTQAPIHVLMRLGQAGQVLGPGIQQGTQLLHTAGRVGMISAGFCSLRLMQQRLHWAHT